MRWATRALIHFDRVASAWLILRFIDRDAQFTFLEDCEVAGSDVILFGVPGARLASHDGRTSTFQLILESRSIRDAALCRFGDIVADVVDHVMRDRACVDLAERDPHVGGALAVAEGTMLLSATDDECLQRSMPLYDALYARLQAQLTLERVATSTPASILEQTIQISNATRVLRESRSRFSSEAFAKALRK